MIDGKEDAAFRGGVIDCFAMGCFRTGASTAFFVVADLWLRGAPHDLPIKCMSVRVIQQKLQSIG